MSLWRPHPTLLVTRSCGFLRHDHALEIIRQLDAMPVDRPITQFHDWLNVSGFDIRCQRDLTAWHVANRKRVQHLGIAADSGLVRMGVMVANMALKGAISLYDEVGAFEEQAQRAADLGR